MKQLNDIKGYWDMNYGYTFSDMNMWKGQMILHEDGWFEGIVNDKSSPYTADRFIFGAYFPDMAIELLKIAPSEVSDPFIFRGQRDVKGYDGEFSVIGLFGEQSCGVSHIITQVSEKQDTTDLQSKIDSYKQSMDENVKDLYPNTAQMRTQFIEIIKRQYQGRTFSQKESEDILRITDPIKADVESKTVNAAKTLVKKYIESTDDDLTF